MPSPPQMPVPPQVTAAERVRVAARRRDETDYIFNYWTALGWTILTFGIYGFYVFYQLVRRMRDHNARRLELLDAATTVAWEQAGRQGLQQEMAPSFERAAGHLAVLRQMTGDFREPVIWLLLAIVVRGITEIVAFVLLDQDLIKHSQAEAGAGSELSVIYGRLGQQVPSPDQGQVKGPDNYVGRILAAIFSLGIYMFWWFYNQMDEPNKHFTSSLGPGGLPRERCQCGQLSVQGPRRLAAARLRMSPQQAETSNKCLARRVTPRGTDQ
jgi:Domain of unknown function (DUF4234)